MGKPDIIMQSYLCDKERFADLFNGVFFQGKQIVNACCLRELFAALKYRKNRNRLQALFLDDDRYRRLSADTAEALSVLLNIPRLQDRWREHMQKNQEEEVYNMCQAWKEIEAECIAKGKAEGKMEGKMEGKTLIVRNMLKYGFSDEEICKLTECSVDFIRQLRLKALKKN